MNYKFDEDEIIKDIQTYVDATYGLHYSNGKYQATDMIIDAGHGEGFCYGKHYEVCYWKKRVEKTI